jgi:hypothetical protein
MNLDKLTERVSCLLSGMYETGSGLMTLRSGPLRVNKEMIECVLKSTHHMQGNRGKTDKEPWLGVKLTRNPGMSMYPN